MKFLSFDIETSGTVEAHALQPWRVLQGAAWITTFAIAWREGELLKSAGEILTDANRPPDLDYMRGRLRRLLVECARRKVVMVGWNLQFDVGWLIALGLEAEVRALVWLDGQRLWKHLDNTPTHQGNRHYNLELANKTFEPVYFGGYKKDVDYHDPSPVVRRHLLEYNKKDTEATLLHVERFWPQLTPRQQQCVKIEAASIPHIAKANVQGMHVVAEKVLQLDFKMRDIGNKLAEKLAPHGCTEKMIRSTPKLRTLLFEKWGNPIVKYTVDAKTGEETDKPSTDKEVIQELSVDDDRVLWVGQWREALNLRTKFVTSLRRSVIYNEEGDKTHPDAILFGTYTSRLTYGSKQGRGKTEVPTGFALHQMKRGPLFRSAIRAPDDHDIVEADAAGQEFRWMAILSGDETMLELCFGGDPHSYLASEIYERDYTELRAAVKSEDEEIATEAGKQRQLGKVGNLSLQYRTSKKRLRIVARTQHGMKMSEDLAAHTWSTYRRTYPKVPVYWRNQIQQAKAQGWVETLAGRRVAVIGDWVEWQWAMESTAINYPIQGTGGEQKYLAIMMLDRIMTTYDAKFAWDLHDGIYFYVPKAKAMTFAAALKKLLDNLPYKQAWDFAPPCPLPWDVKIGPTWGELKEIKW